MTNLPNTKNLELPFGVVLPEVCELYIEFNAHMGSHSTIAEYYRFDGEDWVSEEEHEKAVANNTVWNIRWYPQNADAVGIYCVLASTLEAAIKGLLNTQFCEESR